MIGLYEARCGSLMLIPSTRVIKGLKEERCHLDHTRIAREGAEALGQALLINNIVENLSLVDCALDAKAYMDRRHVLATIQDSVPQAVESIVEGLRCGAESNSRCFRQLTTSVAGPSLGGYQMRKVERLPRMSTERRKLGLSFALISLIWKAA